MAVSHHFLYKNTDLKIISRLFNLLKYFAITPSSLKNHQPHWPQKIYEIVVFLIYTTIFIANTYFLQEKYEKIGSMSLVLVVMCDLNGYLQSGYIFFILMQFRRSSWFKLLKDLRSVPHLLKTKYYNFIIGLTYITFILTTFFGIYVYITFTDFSAKIVVFWIYRQIEFYVHISYALLSFVVLKMLLTRYEYLTKLLNQVGQSTKNLYPKHGLQVLQKVKNHVFVLKEAVEEFNHIFGWTTLSVIFSGTIKTLLFLDYLIKRNFVTMQVYDYPYDIRFGFHEFSFIFVLWVAMLGTIFLSDAVLNECDELLAQAYQLDNGSYNLSLEEIDELNVFIDVVLHNKPEFKAARFFSIDRSTLFSILNSLTTFLLVLIQFKTD